MSANAASQVDDYPPGYGKLAAIEDCDPNLLIVRRFGWLRNAVLLHHQDELVELEEELERLNDNDFRGDYQKLTSRRRDDAIPEEAKRKELLLEIEGKLAKYGELGKLLSEPKGSQKADCI